MTLVLSILFSVVISISIPFFVLGVWLDSSNNIGGDVGPANNYVRKLKFEIRYNKYSYQDCYRLIADHAAQTRTNEIEHALDDNVLDNAHLDSE